MAPIFYVTDDPAILAKLDIAVANQQIEADVPDGTPLRRELGTPAMWLVRSGILCLLLVTTTTAAPRSFALTAGPGKYNDTAST